MNTREPIGFPLRAVSIVAATFLVAAAAGIAAAPVACACSCQTWDTPEEAVQAFDTIFLGTAISKSTEGSYDRYEVEVSAVYTGTVAAMVTISTATETAACGTSVRLNNERLFFAGSTDSDPTRFGVTSCGPSTGESFDAGAVVKQLYGEPTPPESGTASSASSAPQDAASEGAVAESDNTVAIVVAIGAVVAVLGAIGLAIVLWRPRRST